MVMLAFGMIGVIFCELVWAFWVTRSGPVMRKVKPGREYEAVVIRRRNG